MTTVFTQKNPGSHGTTAARVAAEAPDSWRVVRLPHHGVDLAYRDADRPTGITRPAVYAETTEATAAATRGLQQLSDGARKWVRLHEGAMS